MVDVERMNKVRLAIESLKQGELIILTDDDKREQEGDLVGLASFVTAEKVNFALREARGVLCVPMSKRRAEQLSLHQMVQHNTEKFATKFTVSLDSVMGSTGVSAFDRAQTIKALANQNIDASQFESPGHIFPLVAENEGTLRRGGHTEGAVDLARLAGVPEVAYIIEILSADGHMARQKELNNFADRHHLKMLTIEDISWYRQEMKKRSLREGPKVYLPSQFGSFDVTAYEGKKEQPDLFIKSQKKSSGIPLVRIHSECLTGDVLGSERCDCGPQLKLALQLIEREGGAVIYQRQEGRGIGLLEKLRAYVLQQNHYDTIEANLALGHQADRRDYKKAAEVLKFQGLNRIRLLTNNPEKVSELKRYGIEVVEQVPLITGLNINNEEYIHTKKEKFHHLF